MPDRKLLCDVSAPFVVRGTMTYAGVAYRDGDVFDVRAAGLTELGIMQLYQAGRIRNGAPPPPAVDPLAGLLALAAIGAAIQPPAATAKPGKRPRAGA